jgi:protease PrsW
MATLTAIAATALPTIAYTLVIWWLDRYEKEPLPLLLVSFVWGSVPAVGLVLLSELVFRASAVDLFLGPGVTRWALTAVVEEVAKALALCALFVWARNEIDGPLDGIVYGALIGFGFSMSENALYALFGGVSLEQTFWLRGVLFGCNHAFFSGLVGLAFGAARIARGRMRLLVLGGGLLLAIMFHGLHNALADTTFAGLLIAWLVNAGGVVVLLLVAALAWRAERDWLLRQLPEEVALGVIDARLFNETVSAQRRVQAATTALLARGWRAYLLTLRLHQHITELAFDKQRLTEGDPLIVVAQIEQRRRAVQQLRADQRLAH